MVQFELISISLGNQRAAPSVNLCVLARRYLESYFEQRAGVLFRCLNFNSTTGWPGDHRCNGAGVGIHPLEFAHEWLRAECEQIRKTNCKPRQYQTRLLRRFDENRFIRLGTLQVPTAETDCQPCGFKRHATVDSFLLTARLGSLQAAPRSQTTLLLRKMNFPHNNRDRLQSLMLSERRSSLTNGRNQGLV